MSLKLRTAKERHLVVLLRKLFKMEIGKNKASQCWIYVGIISEEELDIVFCHKTRELHRAEIIAHFIEIISLQLLFHNASAGYHRSSLSLKLAKKRKQLHHVILGNELWALWKMQLQKRLTTRKWRALRAPSLSKKRKQLLCFSDIIYSLFVE